MGIDARILLRLKGPKPTETQLTEWSWHLCRSIGAKHFFISDGLPPAEYQKASDAWHEAFNTHPEHAAWDTSRKRDDFIAGNHDDEWRDIGKRIRADIDEPPEQRRRAIELTEYDEADQDAGRIYFQYGETIDADDGEWLLTVNVWSRYYGKGYERGDLLILCAIAEWCEVNLPNCEVWYGGDSSGVEAEPWPDNIRRELRRHLYSQNGKDYFNNRSLHNGPKLRPKTCSLCISDDNFNEFGWGQNYLAVHCHGCGKDFETRDHGKTWVEKKEDR